MTLREETDCQSTIQKNNHKKSVNSWSNTHRILMNICMFFLFMGGFGAIPCCFFHGGMYEFHVFCIFDCQLQRNISKTWVDRGVKPLSRFFFAFWTKIAATKKWGEIYGFFGGVGRFQDHQDQGVFYWGACFPTRWTHSTYKWGYNP